MPIPSLPCRAAATLPSVQRLAHEGVTEGGGRECASTCAQHARSDRHHFRMDLCLAGAVSCSHYSPSLVIATK